MVAFNFVELEATTNITIAPNYHYGHQRPPKLFSYITNPPYIRRRGKMRRLLMLREQD